MPVRIGPAELAALEAHLGAEIDTILAKPSRARSSDPCATSPSAPGFLESEDNFEKVPG
jgi:hypothetical protein